MGATLNSSGRLIYCTNKMMLRPGGRNINQRPCYSVHKRSNCLTYLTLTTLHGLIYCFDGPVECRRHGLTIVGMRGWEAELEDIIAVDKEPKYVYGESAYIISQYMQVTICSVGYTAEHIALNTERSSVSF